MLADRKGETQKKGDVAFLSYKCVVFLAPSSDKQMLFKIHANSKAVNAPRTSTLAFLTAFLCPTL